MLRVVRSPDVMPAHEPGNRTLTPRQIADELQLAVSTVVSHIRAGQIPGGFKVGSTGRWRVDEAAYRTWREGRVQSFDPHRIAPRSARSRAAQEAAERRRLRQRNTR